MVHSWVFRITRPCVKLLHIIATHRLSLWRDTGAPEVPGDDWQEIDPREMAEDGPVLEVATSPDFVNSLSCIEEEANESPGSGSSPISSPVESVPVDEPLDEKLLRLQSRVISMLEMQKRSQEPQKARRKPLTGPPPQSVGTLRGPSGPAKRHSEAAIVERDHKVSSKSCREVKEEVKEGPAEVAEADWRNPPKGAVQCRKNLAKHYKEQLELLEHEEKELQHQMNLRQQLRVVLHDEAQQCERAEKEQSELAARNAHEKDATYELVEENRQLDLLRRQLEEQLRISENRRLQLERENQMLRPQREAAERRGAPPPAPPSRPIIASRKAAPTPASLRTKSPRLEAQRQTGWANRMGKDPERMRF